MIDAPYPSGLGDYMARARVNDPKLAEAVGTTRQQIHKLRHDERKLTVQWAKRLAPHLGVTWQELITGMAPPPVDEEREELLANYEAMGEEQRRALRIMAKTLARPTETERPSPKSPVAPAAQPRGPSPPRPTLGGRVQENRVSPECPENVRPMRAAG